MDSSQGKRGSGRFYLKQVVLLAITVALVAFCTIPLVKAVKGALNPAGLVADLTQSQQDLTGLQNKLDVTRSKMLMGAGDDESQEKLKKQVEELKRQLELKELENKHLQNEVAMAHLIAEMAKGKSAQAPTPAVETTPKADKPAETPKTDKPVDTAQKPDKPVETAQKTDEAAAAPQKTDRLMKTAEEVDKLVAETGQKVDKLVATGKSVWELVIKVFGSLGSVFTGMTFVVSWWKKRRQPPQAAVQVASK